MFRPLVRLSLVTLVAASVLAGCNRDEGGASATTTSSSTTGTAPASGQKLKVVFIPKNTGNPYFDEVQKGCEDAAKELGCDFTTNGPAKGDPTSQIPIINEQVQRGVDVIVISPNSPDALNATLDQARQKGVTVITVDADLVGNESHRDACVLQTDFTKIGPAQIELLGSLTNYEGDFAILSATTSAPNQKVWVADMNKTLADPKYSKMHLVATVFGDDEDQKSQTETQGLVAKYPNLRGIISPTSVGLNAAARILQVNGDYPGGPHAVGKGIELTGLSTPNQLKNYVDKGVVTAFQLWEPANMGYLGVYLGKAVHEKKLTPASGAVLETPKFSKSPMIDNNVIIGGPLVKFDKSNIAKYNF